MCLVGTPIANRRFAELEPLIGFFANTLVLRNRLVSQGDFVQVLEGVRWTALRAFLHQDLPFELLVEDLEPERDLGHTPLFQAMLVLQRNHLAPPRLPGLTVETLDLHNGTSKLDLLLNLEATADGGLVGYWEYDTDLFDATTLGRWANGWKTLLEGILAEPGRPWRELPVLGAAERHQLLCEWFDTSAASGEATVLDFFAEAVIRVPERLAVAGPQALTYGGLDAEAEALARELRSRGVGPDVPVALSGVRTLDSLVAVLAVVKAGGTCLPLDGSYPEVRLAYMRENAAPRVVLEGREARRGGGDVGAGPPR